MFDFYFVSFFDQHANLLHRIEVYLKQSYKTAISAKPKSTGLHTTFYSEKMDVHRQKVNSKNLKKQKEKTEQNSKVLKQQL